MLSGFDVKEHGLYWNSWKPERGYIQVPTVFDAAEKSGGGAAAFVGKQKLEHIAHPGSVDVFSRPGYFCKKVVEEAARYFVEKRPQIEFIHFSDPDDLGHSDGWMSNPQLEAVRHTDKCLGTLLDAVAAAGLDRETLFIISADHGGHGHNHDGKIPEDRLIPWIAWGPGVRARPPHREPDQHRRHRRDRAVGRSATPPPPGQSAAPSSKPSSRDGPPTPRAPYAPAAAPRHAATRSRRIHARDHHHVPLAPHRHRASARWPFPARSLPIEHECAGYRAAKRLSSGVQRARARRDARAARSGIAVRATRSAKRERAPARELKRANASRASANARAATAATLRRVTLEEVDREVHQRPVGPVLVAAVVVVARAGHRRLDVERPVPALDQLVPDPAHRRAAPVGDGRSFVHDLREPEARLQEQPFESRRSAARRDSPSAR